MKRLLSAVLLAILCSSFSPAQETSKPKVRAITGFVRIDRAGYREQMKQAHAMLLAAQKRYEDAGFEVQSVRITTQPFPQYVKGLDRKQALEFLLALDKMAREGKFLLNVGPATMSDADDPTNVEVLAELLSRPGVSASGSTHLATSAGIQWKSVQATAKLVKYVADHSPGSIGNFNFNASAMLEPYTPFYNGAWHDGPGEKFAVGLESANVVAEVFAKHSGNPESAAPELLAELTHHNKSAEEVAMLVAKESGWEYMGIDPTPAPLREVSIGAAFENLTRHSFGTSGTMTAAYIITQAVRAVPVKQVGYSGLMLPVMEDATIARRWSEGVVNIDALLAYSSVCATGLDTIPLPGDITEEQIARILGDVAALAVKWKKPLTARLQPVKGKRVGDMTQFDDPYLVNAKIQPLK